jgi:phosphoglucosamine mutase
VARAQTERPQVVIVRDTRESGEMLESAIAAGVTAAGGDALLAGVLPTPAAPLLVLRHGLQLAAVISASHNPYEDNGIKLFAADGFKLDDDTEHAIEAQLRRARSERSSGPARLRARRHLPRRPGDLPPARSAGRGDR